MAGAKDSDAVDKIKSGLKGLFSRKKKSKGSEPPSATSTQSKPEPPSTEIDSEPASTSQATGKPSTTQSQPVTVTKEPIVSRGDPEAGFREIPKVKPIEGMSATSGPLDNFEFMTQSKAISEPPNESSEKDQLQPEATAAQAQAPEEASHKEPATTEINEPPPAASDETPHQEEHPEAPR